MRRVEQGEKRRRAAVLQDKLSFAVAGFGFFAEGELFGCFGAFIKTHIVAPDTSVRTPHVV